MGRSMEPSSWTCSCLSEVTISHSTCMQLSENGKVFGRHCKRALVTTANLHSGHAAQPGRNAHHRMCWHVCIRSAASMLHVPRPIQEALMLQQAPTRTCATHNGMYAPLHTRENREVVDEPIDEGPCIAQVRSGPGGHAAACKVQQPVCKTHSPLFAAVNGMIGYRRRDPRPDWTCLCLQQETFVCQPHHPVPTKDRCGRDCTAAAMHQVLAVDGVSACMSRKAPCTVPVLPSPCQQHLRSHWRLPPAAPLPSGVCRSRSDGRIGVSAGGFQAARSSAVVAGKVSCPSCSSSSMHRVSSVPDHGY
jgi:hypothetical protein